MRFTVAEFKKTGRHRSRMPWMLAGWLACMVVGFCILLREQFTPGAIGITPLTWPARATIARHTSGSHLLMFVHPHCPCSRASLLELERLLAKSPDTSRFDVYVSGTEETAAGADTAPRGAWLKRDIPGIRFHTDPGGAACTRVWRAGFRAHPGL